MTKTKNENRMRSARAAVLVMFFVNGMLFANWVSRIPAVQLRTGLSEGLLGLALMGGACGVIFGLLMSGGWIARLGSRKTTVVSALLMCLVLPLPGLALNFAGLFGALFLVAMCVSTMDIAMNAQAIEVERLYNKSIMSSFHALYSMGGVVGALVGSLIASLGFAPFEHFILVGIALIFITLLAGSWLLEIDGEKSSNQPRFSLPHRAVLPLGVIAFCAALGEGSMADWSGIYLRDYVGVDGALAAYGFAAFSAAMTVGRFAGDSLAARFSVVWLVRGGGLLAAVGLMAALLLPSLPVVLAGFAAVGLGLSVTIPLTFSAAGRMKEIPAGQALAGVATIGYAGFLAGPPVIGLIAEVLSLQVSLVIVAVLIASLVITGHAIRE